MRIPVNTSGSYPTITISTDASGNALANGISVISTQKITITNNNPTYEYTTFQDKDTNVLTLPAKNSIATTIVIDDVNYFGNTTATSGSAAYLGIAGIASNKVPVNFRVTLNGTSTTTGSRYYAGTGYITNLSPEASPEAPIWITPISIAVNGSYTTGVQ